MNINIKKISIENVLFFDCETVRKSEVLDPNSKEFELYQKKLRDRDTDELPTEEETILNYERKAPLKLGHSKIVTIGCGFVKDDVVYVKAITGTEGEILKQFFQITNQFDYLCGFNIIGYDIPHCTLNAAKYFDYTDTLPDRFVTSGKKPWNLDKVLDMMEIVRGTSYAIMSFDEALYHFGLESSKIDIDGSQVSETWYAGEEQRVVDYVKQDVFQSINLFRKLQFKEPFTEFTDRSSAKVEIVEKHPLQKLYDIDYLSDEIKEQLKKAFGKKKLTKKDKEFMQDIIENVYIKTTFMQSDTNDVKIAKKSEIEEFLKDF